MYARLLLLIDRHGSGATLNAHMGLELPLTSRSSKPSNYQAVLLAVVQPVARTPRPDDALELVGFHPNDFIHPLVPGCGGDGESD